MTGSSEKRSSTVKFPLYGLVLTGGRGTRMKKDKSLLVYHGKSQVQYCYDLLLRCCKRVFVSNRKDQSTLQEHKDLPQIHDRFVDIGPLDGILSAMSEHPKVAWLVLACDLPNVDEDVLNELISQRDRSRMATAYRSVHDGLPEPLCAIYEPAGIGALLEFLSKGITCPRKILIGADIKLIEQECKTSLDNINEPADYEAFRRKGESD